MPRSGLSIFHLMGIEYTVVMGCDFEVGRSCDYFQTTFIKLDSLFTSHFSVFLKFIIQKHLKLE